MKKILALVLALAMVLSLAACSSTPAESAAPTDAPAESAEAPAESAEAPADNAEPSVINVCLASEPDTIDPALNSAVDGATLTAHLFSGLAKWAQDENGNLEIVADAVTGWPSDQVMPSRRV